jgi:hypothetical protein
MAAPEGLLLKLKVDDYYHNGRRRLRLHEKGGKEHEMPVHHLLEQILNEYVETAGLRSGQPLFQSVNSAGTAVTGRALNRYNAWTAIRKRAKAAGFLTPVGCHTWRATGITIYLENDGRLEHAQQNGGTRVSPNDQALRPDKERNYAERGGANSAVTHERSIATRERYLVGHDVRWEETAADQESHQPLSHQFPDAAGYEEEYRRPPGIETSK